MLPSKVLGQSPVRRAGQKECVLCVGLVGFNHSLPMFSNLKIKTLAVKLIMVVMRWVTANFWGILINPLVPKSAADGFDSSPQGGRRRL